MCKRDDLRAYACPIGDRAYLAVPLAWSWTEAVAFSRWQNGMLFSPANEEQYTAVVQYLATVVMSEAPIRHYLGLLIDQESQSVHWQSGMPYTWHRWQQPTNFLFRPHRGAPSFISNITHYYHLWWDIECSLLFPPFMILEWDISVS